MITLNQFGFVRAAVAVPHLEVGNPLYNVKKIYGLAARAFALKAQVLLFPEQSITGYSAGDLFNQRALLEAAENGLADLLQATREMGMLIAAGLPVKADNQLFNCAVVFSKGEILGVVPKTFLPNYNEFYERRWFASPENRLSGKVRLCGQEVPFNENLLFKDENSELMVGLEICEDLWMPVPPSSYHAQQGANLILNLSASNETVGKAAYRRELVKQQSARCLAGYLYASAGPSESTTDLVFGGHALIAENGSLFKEERMSGEETLLVQDLDIERVMNDRRKFNSFMGRVEPRAYETVTFQLESKTVETLERAIDPYPFVPAGAEDRNERCSEIFNIQATGLAQRLAKTGVKKAVLGISGGLDSTLALLVTCVALEKNKLARQNLIGITMPGFGTSDRTYDNALVVMKKLGITAKTIPIRDASLLHMRDIGHDPSVHDVVYENIQARERTQILMDVANQEGGLVIGTGDLSELALGWATYNGDHMSMYAVNSSIPKTLVRYLVKWYAETTEDREVQNALRDILETPVSPELLPLDDLGNIKQKTEDIVGPYELHDFFLYNMLRFGYTPKKILLLAENAFGNSYAKEEIVRWLKLFYKRFFTQQFKRSCMPDGVKVGSVALSPRGDWRMPSDASYRVWLNELI